MRAPRGARDAVVFAALVLAGYVLMRAVGIEGAVRVRHHRGHRARGMVARVPRAALAGERLVHRAVDVRAEAAPGVPIRDARCVIGPDPVEPLGHPRQLAHRHLAIRLDLDRKSVV